ncbi:Uncharacterized protein ALO43_02869 [Pseudomonas tremae]|uniref:ATP-binding protein n=1 Tax=Pseudomonas tremae TaxID=200454 RepID=A0AA40TT41_9PSED|nr:MULTISPECIES: ATP-binding protein [Pseudomonas syringae group]KPY93153.1 Uncharacterized protein ALO43_02869 [Pseudomonas tremae]RMO09205.1 hypothetical protein ALQ48_01877 [Pseudomonas coronafaciens pv. zizaniae]
MKKAQEINVDTRPSKAVVVDSLTRDISVEACIFDLIDNSIDAARNTMFKINPELGESILPESYSGYKITIFMSGDVFSIEDNCGGIAIPHLEKSVLRFGERSAHNLGIGVFGVGLNRAIFRIGRQTNLDTDTGLECSVLEFNTEEYLATEDWDIKAERHPSRGIVGTKISISAFTNETSQLFAGRDWVRDIMLEAGRRYGRFIDKGLLININNDDVDSHIVRIRPDSPYGIDSKFFKVSGDISVFIESGQHLHHRFSAEPDYNKSKNTVLTADYGWNVFCNERAVLISDRTRKSGWLTKFHSEFYGFVGHVYFTCKDPSRLPWNTTKSDVDLNNVAYHAALDDMTKFALNWRKNSGDAKQKRRDLEPLSPAPGGNPNPIPSPNPAGKPASNPQPNPASNPKPKTPIKKPIQKIDHNQFITVLPQDIDQRYCYDKHLALVHEAQRLNLGDLTYAGLVLIRMLFEASAICFLKRRDIYGELREAVVVSRNAERGKSSRKLLTPKEERNVEPTVDEIILFLQGSESVWDGSIKNKIKHSLTKFSAFKPTLNSAAHNTFQMLNKYEAFNVRDAVLPILRYLIETE